MILTECAHHLASQMIMLLSPVLPEEFEVVEESPGVIALRSRAKSGATEKVNLNNELSAGGVLPEDRVRGVALEVLSFVQDFVSEDSRYPWPHTSGGLNLALPGAQIEGARLRLWYGGEDDPAVDLGSISIERCVNG